MMIPYFMQHGCTIRKAKARLKLQLSWGCPASRLSNTCKQPGKWTGSYQPDVNVFGSIDAALQIRDKFNLQRVIIVPDGEHAGKRDDTKLMRTRLHVPVACI